MPIHWCSASESEHSDFSGQTAGETVPAGCWIAVSREIVHRPGVPLSVQLRQIDGARSSHHALCWHSVRQPLFLCLGCKSHRLSQLSDLAFSLYLKMSCLHFPSHHRNSQRVWFYCDSLIKRKPWAKKCQRSSTVVEGRLTNQNHRRSQDLGANWDGSTVAPGSRGWTHNHNELIVRTVCDCTGENKKSCAWRRVDCSDQKGKVAWGLQAHKARQLTFLWCFMTANSDFSWSWHTSRRGPCKDCCRTLLQLLIFWCFGKANQCVSTEVIDLHKLGVPSYFCLTEGSCRSVSESSISSCWTNVFSVYCNHATGNMMCFCRCEQLWFLVSCSISCFVPFLSQKKVISTKQFFFTPLRPSDR